MCGRYTIELSGGAIQQRFLTEEQPSFDGTYNAAPGERLPVITREDTTRCELGVWGFQPGWAGPGHEGFINARLETAADKASFQDAWHGRRCLVPATGFYEWDGDTGGKTPYYFAVEDEDLFSFAGLWAADQKGRLTYTVLTRPANDDVSGVHDRMPVILSAEEEGSWMVNRLGADRLLGERPGLSSHQVTKAVNTPGNDGAFLTEPRDTLEDFSE